MRWLLNQTLGIFCIIAFLKIVVENVLNPDILIKYIYFVSSDKCRFFQAFLILSSPSPKDLPQLSHNKLELTLKFCIHQLLTMKECSQNKNQSVKLYWKGLLYLTDCKLILR